MLAFEGYSLVKLSPYVHFPFCLCCSPCLLLLNAEPCHSSLLWICLYSSEALPVHLSLPNQSWLPYLLSARILLIFFLILIFALSNSTLYLGITFYGWQDNIKILLFKVAVFCLPVPLQGLNLCAESRQTVEVCVPFVATQGPSSQKGKLSVSTSEVLFVIGMTS